MSCEGATKAAGKNTNPEGCEPFHLDQQLALDPYLTCSRCFQLIRLAASRGHGSGSGLTDQSGKPIRSSGFYVCLSQSPVRLDQQLAIDPCCPSKTHRRMSFISRPASSRLAKPSGKSVRPDCPCAGLRPARGPSWSCDRRAPEELRSSGPVAFAGARLGSSPALPCRGGDAKELALSHRGTAVPGLQQLPLPDSLMTSKSVDGLSELA